MKSRGKSRQNAEDAEDKQTFDLTEKIEIEGKTGKNRQNAENKQSFGLTGKIEIIEKLVKRLKINKLSIRQENLKITYGWIIRSTDC